MFGAGGAIAFVTNQLGLWGMSSDSSGTTYETNAPTQLENIGGDVVGDQSVQTTDDSAWSAAYERFVTDGAYLAVDDIDLSYSTEEPTFCLYDMDADGMPELLLAYNTGMSTGRAVSMCAIFAYRDGSVQYCGDITRPCSGISGYAGLFSSRTWVGSDYRSLYPEYADAYTIARENYWATMEEGSVTLSDLISVTFYETSDSDGMTVTKTDNAELLAIAGARKVALDFETSADIESMGWEAFVSAQISGADAVMGEGAVGFRVGVYHYDDGNKGLYYTITAVSDTEVSGFNVYSYGDSLYDSADFSWTLTSTSTATEPFQNGYEVITYRAQEDGFLADYPAGWWPDRMYTYLCAPDEATRYVTNPAYPGVSSEASTDNAASQTSFWGIWVTASKRRSECDSTVADLRSKGFDAATYLTTDWANLNSEPWYVVSAGTYATQAAAEASLVSVRAAGYADAYVKYSGEHK